MAIELPVKWIQTLDYNTISDIDATFLLHSRERQQQQ
jgi:hypothetical protein